MEFNPNVTYQPGVREDILGGIPKHLTRYVQLRKKILFRDKH
jgi:hypothetical protein